EAARRLIHTAPAICVFFKPRMSGMRYLKEMDNQVVITWSLSEPAGNIQDFTWTPTVNRFQAILRRDGSIQMSWNEIAAKDGIVGIYPVPKNGAENEIAAWGAEGNTASPGPLDIKRIKLSAIDSIFLKVTLEIREPLSPEGDPANAGL